MSTYSLYDGTVAMAQGALISLARMLDEAEKHDTSSAFFSARLIDDMKPLSFQIHYVTFQSCYLSARLCGKEYVEPPKYPESYAEAHSRLNEATKALAALERDSVNRVGETMTSFVRRDEPIEVPVKAIVGLWNMPNVWFHLGMVYAILRKEGVPLGKRDWSRGFVREYV